jgi:putative membrane protein
MKMKKITQWIFVGMFAVLVPLTGNALAQWPGRGYDEWGHGPGMMGGYGGGWVGGILMVIFWIAVIIGIIFLIRWLVQSTSAGGHGARSEESALEILKKRYARGEIDKKEFEQKKKDLV